MPQTYKVEIQAGDEYDVVYIAAEDRPELDARMHSIYGPIPRDLLTITEVDDADVPPDEEVL